ncbi:hypothetical protein H0H81_002050 [Sphagnurus paluster]|uniref:Uncharacterized protein n=1 Tax=Sphagnurus paluster TaxID=117069 RepID=A0A9P7FT98_9AGAR|nr:hypothetical protein H0H81_002050 [Sphagnurus paluster]
MSHASLPNSEAENDTPDIIAVTDWLCSQVAEGDRETAPLAFPPIITILHDLLKRDAKEDIHIGMLHRNTAEDAAANFAIIVDTIMPLIKKMVFCKAEIDYTNPDISKFLQLTGVHNNPCFFKDPNDDTILSLQDDLTQLKSLTQEKDLQINSLHNQIASLQAENNWLGKQPATSGVLTSPSPMELFVQELQAPAAAVWVPDHTLHLKGKYNKANFPGWAPHPIITSTQYPKGTPECYKRTPRNGTAILPKFPPKATTTQGSKTKDKRKGKGKATLGPSPSQAESFKAPAGIPQHIECNLFTMPEFEWAEDIEHAITQGAAALEANLPPLHYNPPPPPEPSCSFLKTTTMTKTCHLTTPQAAPSTPPHPLSLPAHAPTAEWQKGTPTPLTTTLAPSTAPS